MITLKNNTPKSIAISVLVQGDWQTVAIRARGVFSGEFTAVDASTERLIAAGAIVVLSGSLSLSVSLPVGSDRPILKGEADRTYATKRELTANTATMAEVLAAMAVLELQFTWSGLPGKPAVIAAGATRDAALDVLELRTSLYSSPGETQAVDLQYRRLLDDGGFATLDWQIPTLRASDGSTSILWDARNLINAADVNTVNWEAGFLLSPLDTFTSVNWASRYLGDSAEAVSTDWENRLLYNTLGMGTLSWENQSLHDTFGNVSTRWDSRELLDDGEGTSVNWGNRTLVNGLNIVTLGWADGDLLDYTTTQSLNWIDRLMINTAGTPVAYWGLGLRLLTASFEDSSIRSGAGAVSIAFPCCKITTTGAGQALTLANGSADGQRLFLVHAVDGGSAVLTPTTKTGFTTITFNNAGDTAELQFFTTIGWVIRSLRGAVSA